MRKPAQTQPGLYAWLRTQQAAAPLLVQRVSRRAGHIQLAGLPQRQRGGGLTRRTGDPHVIANARTIAPQRRARRHATDCRYSARERPAGGVAADQHDVVRIGQREEAIGE